MNYYPQIVTTVPKKIHKSVIMFTCKFGHKNYQDNYHYYANGALHSGPQHCSILISRLKLISVHVQFCP
jgi:hypothetical protein